MCVDHNGFLFRKNNNSNSNKFVLSNPSSLLFNWTYCILSFWNQLILQTFARRGLCKIQELSQLESMSSSTDTPDREAAFRQATIKVSTTTIHIYLVPIATFLNLQQHPVKLCPADESAFQISNFSVKELFNNEK